MPEGVFLLAVTNRVRFSLETSDALHLATVQYHRCDALWTNEMRLDQAASHSLTRNVLGLTSHVQQ